MEYCVEPIGYVKAARTRPEDDGWGEQAAEITLVHTLAPEALAGLDAFSHVEVLFIFHQVPESAITSTARHPRDNPDWPRVGIFAQRGKNRPNRIGTTICRVLQVDGVKLRVADLDAIDGTPVIDLKPVMREFLPRQTVVQPSWATELMAHYWSSHS